MTATTLLFADNASTVLASSITAAATTCTLAPGTGALFPNPGANQAFPMSFVDAATGLLTEIVLVTARSGDTITTMVRGQEGTAARAWLAADLANCFWTAGALGAGAMAQIGPLQQGTYGYAVDSGSANAIVLTMTPAITSYVDGFPINFKAAANNTGATTININGVGAVALQGAAGALQGGEIVAGKTYEGNYNATSSTFVLLGQGGGAEQIAPATASQHAVQAAQVTGIYAVRGLQGQNNATTPTTSFDFTAALVSLRSVATGLVLAMPATSTITNSTSTAGPATNCRDQSAAFTTNSWVYFYYIWNGTTLATISSNSAPAVGPTLPTGYTHWSYIGAVFWNGTTLALGSFRGSWFNYNQGQAAVTGGGSTTLVAVSVASLVPPSASAPGFEIFVQNFAISATSGGSYGISGQIVIASSGQALVFGMQGVGGASATFSMGGPVKRINNLGQNFAYSVSISQGVGPANNIWVNGYSNANGDN
jgi:hypothetical protein